MKIIAHRGYSAKYPENTLIAFEKAIFHGADMIELDITLTKDHKMVVIHDDMLDRTTPTKGLVVDHTLEQVQSLDAGSWFAPEFSKEKIPTLLDVLRSFGREIAINIEVKKEAVSLDPDQSIEKPLMDALQGFGGLAGIQFSSFEPLALHRLRKMMPQAMLCYTTKASPNDEIRKEMKYLDIFEQHICIQDVTDMDVQYAHKMGWRIAAYTVNTENDFAKAKSLGLDGIFTDEVEKAKSWNWSS